MERTKTLLLFIATSLPYGAAAADQGSLCIARIAPQPAGKALELGHVRDLTPYRFEITISGQGKVVPSTHGGVLLGPMPLNELRRISITNHGRPFASFSTRQPVAAAPQACLKFDAMYQTWSMVTDPTRLRRCGCDAGK